MNLLEIKDKQKGINIKVVITKKDPVQEVQRGDRVLKVAHCYIEDEEHNKGYLSLWNTDCDNFDVGDIVEIVNGYCHIYEGNPNLSAGVTGVLKKA